jgi:hypothetical protein
MAVLRPTDLFPSYDLTNGVISIDVADIVGITDVEAHPTTGNGSEVVRCLVNSFQQTYATKSAAAAAPLSWSATKNTPTGVNAGTVAQTYLFSFSTVQNPTTAVLIPDV